MSKGIFIAGTDTGVGKTFVASGLIIAFRAAGNAVCPMKPIETGCISRKGQLVPEDALKLVQSAGIHESLDLVNPYRFRQPLAPAVASDLERTVIKKNKILSAYKQLSCKYDVMIVEGAGGIMAPVYKKYLFLDLIKDLNLPIAIVARAGLGTINHTLLTIKAAQSMGIDVTGVIVNNTSKSATDVSLKTNPRMIEKLSGRPVLGIVPFMRYPQKNIFRNIALEIMSRF
ncbi:MAG: dethiobiotin synthase [Nitrospiraceae bacterium]|nr:MAG: dethiobiotin synthase [Nitrospiraceae bacterium]